MKKSCLAVLSLSLSLLFCVRLAHAQAAPAAPATAPKVEPDKRDEGDSKTTEASKRVELNLLGKTDAASGESRRNENIQFNLVDNNALKELNVRLGTTATIIREFSPANGYFGSEFGNAPRASITVPAALKAGFHGRLFENHLNSVFTARAFFQVGEVQPARENEYGFNFGLNLWRNAKFFADASQQQVRGSVNGNVLVPRPDERTPLATDPATRAIVQKYLSAYPAALPNRTDINARALNTNAPQAVTNRQSNWRLDQLLNARDQVALQYQFTAQSVDAFQFVAGQNPDTQTKSHLARLAWTRSWNARTVSSLVFSYDRLTTSLQPEPNAVGQFVSPAGLTSLGPDGTIPLERAQNQIRSAGQLHYSFGRHEFLTGATLLRRQVNGSETDVHRGYFSFSNDFGNDAVTNLRLGRPSQHIVSIGDIQRGFRLWEAQLFAGDKWQVNQRLTLQYGLRWQPVTKPSEVQQRNIVPYDSDWNNFAPNLGWAYRLPQRFGVVRGAYGTHFGEIFFVTYQQLRFSPPGNVKLVVVAPPLVNPLSAATGKPRPVIYTLDPALATPYSHQYNLSWEPEWSQQWRLQIGYIGSRSHKLLNMWYLNRARPVPGVEQITATINDRRPDQTITDYRLVVNGSRGYFDAARVALVMPNWHGLTIDTAYWFSKALDLGSTYTNTANENDSRLGRSQSENDIQRDMKALSVFDQTHSFLWRTSYLVRVPKAAARWRAAASALANGWTFSSVVLVKTGLPFNVLSGSDGPGFGNVDGNGADRPNLLDVSILGRTIADPDTSRQLLPRSAFAFIKPTDARGNLGRNVFRKGPIRNVNASLTRVWSFKHDLRLSFRAESINLFNTPQFAEPGFELANPNFGAITNTLNEGRTFRFGLQLGW